MNNVPSKALTEELTSVFRTVGQPTVTYVERASGALERDLDGALSENGQLCLICGPSKTGKTTLYREVLRRRNEEPLVVRCDRALTAEQVWLKALEEVDFERAESRSTAKTIGGTVEIEAQGKFGWKWLAEASSRLKGTMSSSATSTDIRKNILANPGSDLLIPVLQSTNYRLVIEDFHYLQDDQKTILFEQWKRFTDHEISVIVLGTTHRAVDIANSNKDLVGRITQINVGHWSIADLSKVGELGFKFLEIEAPKSCLDKIAKEAVGLPIIVQQTCLALVSENGERYINDVRGKSGLVKLSRISDALHQVAIKRYSQFEDSYSTLVKGPREKARKYRTYELVLSCFRLDPIKFSVGKTELIDRMNRLKLADAERPPLPSINSTLAALSKFQHVRELELLEWRPKQQILHITEPSFLFYVRWREKKDMRDALADILRDFDFTPKFVASHNAMRFFSDAVRRHNFNTDEKK